jgi:hypothetical protein
MMETGASGICLTTRTHASEHLRCVTYSGLSPCMFKLSKSQPADSRSSAIVTLPENAAQCIVVFSSYNYKYNSSLLLTVTLSGSVATW